MHFLFKVFLKLNKIFPPILFGWLHILNAFQGSQRELLNLSQQDYANRIEELNQSLKEAWAADQKVKALKIVIQVVQQWCETLTPLQYSTLSSMLI